jgi:hypothetical protein
MIYGCIYNCCHIVPRSAGVHSFRDQSGGKIMSGLVKFGPGKIEEIATLVSLVFCDGISTEFAGVLPQRPGLMSVITSQPTSS